MDDLELAQILRSVMRNGVFLTRSWGEHMQLSSSQLSALNMLELRNMRVTELGRNLGVQLPSATELLKGLDRYGYIERFKDPEDFRAVIIQITPAGREACHQGNLERNEKVAAVFRTLSDEDRAKIFAAAPALQVLGEAFGKNILKRGQRVE